MKRTLLIFSLLLSGCFTTTIQSRPTFPAWVNDIAKVCSQMAMRNINYVAKHDNDITNDRQIIESDTRFYLGLIQMIQERKERFQLEEESRRRFHMNDSR